MSVEPVNQDKFALETVINNLDQRGVLVMQVLLGQRAIALLEAEKTKEVKSSIIQNKPKLIV